MDYTSSYASEGSITTSAIEIVSPASNTAGVEVSNMVIESGSPHCAFLAKSSTPTSTSDGAVLMYAKGGTGVNRGPTDKIVVPPGQGVYFIGNTSGMPFRSALLKVL